MTSNEEALLQAINRREWCTFGTAAPDAPAGLAIAGSFIRDLLLGVVPGQERLSYAFGVRLYGAYIEGAIDLNDGRNADLGPLPPLLLEHCTLAGDAQDVREAALKARHAVLARVSLTGSRFGRIDISDARIEGDLAIDCVAALAGGPSCQLTARGTAIDGRINARGAHFKIPHGQKIPDFDINDYAFDLTNAYIASSLYLSPGFVADGGISMLGAQVEGDVWCLGAQLMAGAGAAFRGQSLSCRGALSFACAGSVQSRIDGDIDLLGARCLELVLSDIIFSPGRTLLMSNATVAGSVYVSSPSLSALELMNATVEGSIHFDTLYSAAVAGAGTPDKLSQTVNGNGMTVHGAAHFKLFRGSLSIDNADIEGGCLIEPAQLQTLNATGTVIKGALKVLAHPDAHQGPDYAIYAYNLDIGEDLRISMPPGQIRLSGSRVRNDLVIFLFDPAPGRRVDALIYADNICIDNNCSARNIPGTFSLNTATIGGTLDIAANGLAILDARDIKVRGPSTLAGTLVQSEKDHMARFDGSEFDGELHLSDIRFVQMPGFVPELSFNDTNIERDLHVSAISIQPPPSHAWASIEPMQYAFGSLAFYPDYALYEAALRFDAHTIGILAFLRDKNNPDQLILLAGDSATIHALNKSGALLLDTPEHAARYLRFFSSHVWAESGPFQIIESDAELAPPLVAAFDEGQHFEPITATGMHDGGWGCTATVAYEDNVHFCSFTVRPDGAVAMETDQRIGALQDAPQTRLERPLRLVSRKAAIVLAEPYFLVKGCVASYETAGPDPDLHRLLRQLVGERPEVAPTLAATVSLIGSKAAAVSYPGEQAWGKGVRALLEGFSYGRMEFVKDARASFASAAQTTAKPPVSPGQLAQQRNTHWLHLQFPDGDPKNIPADEAYSPQPHEHLAAQLRSHGRNDEAIEVMLDRLRIERKLTLKGLRWGVDVLLDCFFRYGLRPRRGVAWCLVFLTMGGIGFDVLNYGYVRWWPASRAVVYLEQPVLVVDSVAVSPLIAVNRAGFGSPSMEHASASDVRLSEEYRCGEQVDPFLYAIELFVPLLDLGQQDKCTITTRPSAFGYRLAKFVYTGIGSIFTSLTLLSIAGVLRRRIEQ